MYVWYRIPVRNSGAVEGTIVATGSPVSRRFLGYHVKRGGPWAGGGADDAQLEHVFKFPLCNLQAVRGQTSGTGEHRWASCLNVVSDGVAHRGVRCGDLGE